MCSAVCGCGKIVRLGGDADWVVGLVREIWEGFKY